MEISVKALCAIFGGFFLNAVVTVVTSIIFKIDLEKNHQEIIEDSLKRITSSYDLKRINEKLSKRIEAMEQKEKEEKESFQALLKRIKK